MEPYHPRRPALKAAATSARGGRTLWSVLPSRRLLLVHAHPDDETIGTGATMARYAADGAQVTLLTCTLGEEGEILVPALELLRADAADQLGGYRIGELAEAMRHLGVTDHRFLGGAGRFRDSGMMDTSANDHPRALWRAARDPEVFDAAVGAALDVIRETRPQVVISYDPNGDYGHPDHIMAHRVVAAAVAGAADIVAKFYWTATPRSMLRRGFEALKASGSSYFAVDSVEDLPFGVEDDVITTVIDARAHASAKLSALRAHATQISVDAPFFALSNMLGREVLAVEHFRLASGELGPDRDGDGWETDLFSGIAP
jgi:N-acetyl-1-D-myo-inositol-2-amino-2-deoxy-alpha-D-glucopyranoside deacetylase